MNEKNIFRGKYVVYMYSVIDKEESFPVALFMSEDDAKSYVKNNFVVGAAYYEKLDMKLELCGGK